MKNTFVFSILIILIFPYFLSAQSDFCEDEIEQMEVIVTMGNSENRSWGMASLDGNNVITIDGELYAGYPPGYQMVHNIEVNRCLGYEIYFEKDFMKDSLYSPSLELVSSNLDLGNEINEGMNLGKSSVLFIDSMTLGGNSKYPFFLPCSSECSVENVILADGECVGSISIDTIISKTCLDGNQDCEVEQNVYFLYNGLPYIGIGPIPLSSSYTFMDIPAGNHKIVHELIYCDGVITKCTSDVKIYHVIPDVSENTEENVVVQLAQPEIDDDDNLNGDVIDDLGECFIRITPDMVLKDYSNGCYESKISFLNGIENMPLAFGETPFENHYYDVNSDYEIIVMDESGVPLTQKELIERDWDLDAFGLPIHPFKTNIPKAHDIVGPNEVGKTLAFKIIHLGTGSVGWGTLTVEDKVAPIIVCNDYEINCTHPWGLDEFYEHEEIFMPNKDDLPAGIYFGWENMPLSTWIPINVSNLRKGEVIKEICIDLDLDGAGVLNLVEVFLHPPTKLVDFPIRLDTCHWCLTSRNKFCSFDNDGLEKLNNLKSSNGNSTIFDYQIIEGVEDSFLPSLYGKTWYIQVRNSQVNNILIDPGEVNKLEMKIKSGFPIPTTTYDCTFESVKLLNEKISPILCNGGPYSGKIERTWQAQDSSGNKSQCQQTVLLIAPEISDIQIPADLTLDCSKTLSPEHVLPSISGAPFFEESVIGEICNVSITYSDKIIYDCGYGFTIERTWSYATFCTGQSREEKQVITVTDKKGPHIKNDTIVLGTNLYICDGTLMLEDLEIEDRCSGIKDVKIFHNGPGSDYNPNAQHYILNLTNGEIFENLSIGNPTGIRLVAIDSCTNILDTIVYIKVIDNTSPQAIIEPLFFDMGSDSCKLMFADDIGGGSGDNCTTIDLKIRVVGDSIWQDSILLCCGDNVKIAVELRVEDGFNNVNTVSDFITLSCDTISAISDVFENDFKLFQNIPNPFHNETVIGFYLPTQEFINLNIVDISGRIIKTYNRYYGIGNHEIKIDIPLSAGVYYYQLISRSHSVTKKMLVLE